VHFCIYNVGFACFIFKYSIGTLILVLIIANIDDNLFKFFNYMVFLILNSYLLYHSLDNILLEFNDILRQNFVHLPLLFKLILHCF